MLRTVLAQAEAPTAGGAAFDEILIASAMAFRCVGVLMRNAGSVPTPFMP